MRRRCAASAGGSCGWASLYVVRPFYQGYPLAAPFLLVQALYLDVLPYSHLYLVEVLYNICGCFVEAYFPQCVEKAIPIAGVAVTLMRANIAWAGTIRYCKHGGRIQQVQHPRSLSTISPF